MDFDWISMVRELGPLASIILFFVWRDWKREQHLFIRIEKLENYHKETLVHLIEKSVLILTQNTECLKRVERIVDQLCNKFTENTIDT